MANEIIQMPVKARIVLERYQDCMIKTLTTLSWSALHMRHTSPDQVVVEARQAGLEELVRIAAVAIGKDNVVTSVSQDFEGCTIISRMIAMSPAKFEEMITEIYVQGVLEGRRGNPNAI